MAWAAIKLGRVQQYRSLPLYGSETQPLWFNIPDQVQHELMLIDQQLAGRLGAEDESPLSQHQRDRFIISALRDEAIASSMLEGAATTRRDASQMLKTGRKPRTQGERMVLNNYQAIQFIRENRKVDLSPAFLLELQAILTERTLDKKDAVGRFRTADDDITVVDGRDNEVIHVPPPAAELPERLERLCRFANQHSSVKEFIHPVARACVLHFQLGFDHPFCDGNGRTARAIFYWLVLRAAYWLFEYLPISRLIYRGPAKYARAFLYCETDEFDVTYFLMYKAKIISRARQELREYIGAKQQQIAQARRLFSSDGRLNHRQQEVVLQATRNPDQAFTIADHQGRYAVVYGTARSDLMKLAQWGYLEQQKIGKRYDFLPAPRLASLDGE
ncbi:MAG: Fic family protein [bacterium]|nr:Fic family protein [bacterium]